MGDSREAGRTAPMNHDAMHGNSSLSVESPLTMVYWDNAFGFGWQNHVQEVFNRRFLWEDRLQFFLQPQRHKYVINGQEYASDMFYLGQQFGGPGAKHKIHIAAALAGASSTRHIHEHTGGLEMYFPVFGDTILVIGDDNSLAVDRLDIERFHRVPQNTWHQARSLDQHSLIIVTNYNARGVEEDKLHRLHENQLRHWKALEEKIIYFRAA